MNVMNTVNTSAARTTIPNEFNEKIKTMNLVALRKYACPKVASLQDWYIHCISCKGLDGCSAGKRVVDILESQTKPIDSIFEKAVKNRDPVQWLLNEGYYSSRGSAINNLNRWKREHGMKSQIEKFNERIAKKEEIKHPTPHPISQDEKFELALKQSDPIGWLVQQGYYSERKYAGNKLSEWKRKKARGIPTKPYQITISKKKKEITELLQSSPDINALIVNYLKSMKPRILVLSAASKAWEWARKETYSDIKGIKRFCEVGTLLGLDTYGRITVEDFLKKYEQADFTQLHMETIQNTPKGRPVKKQAAEEEDITEDDEISLEDFLNEMEDPEEDEETEAAVQEENTMNENMSNDPLFNGFKAKIDELRKKKDSIMTELKAVDEDISKIIQAASIMGYTIQ